MYEVPEYLIIEQVEAHMRELGISPKDNIRLQADGELHRYCVEGDKAGTKNGAYRIHTDGIPAWYLCDWKRNIDVTGRFDDSRLSDADRKAYTERINDKSYMESSRIHRENIEYEERKRKREATKKAQELYEQAPPAPPEHEYLRQKRIAHIQDFRLGEKGELLIPLHHAGKTKDFMSLQRIFPNGKKYFIQDTATCPACYEFEPEEENDRLIFICEGIATGETIYRLTWKRFRVVCAMNCNNLLQVTEGIKERYPRAEILIGADNDLGTYAKTGNNPGRSRAEFVVKAGHAKGIIIPDFLAHQDGSDWNDYEKINGADKAADEFFRQLDEVLSQKDKPEQPTEEEKDKAQLVFERLCAIRENFLKGKHIFYVGSVNHGEYYQYSQAGYWYRMTDAELQAELSTFLNHKESNKHIHELATMIRLMVTRPEIPAWNKGRLDNFPNGTLELDSGVFREHRPEDYLTFIHTFDYNPSATECKVYDSFMKAVTNGEQSRFNFLEDMLAYGLYEDNRLEKLFFLIGGGANGKGTFLHMAEDLFTSSNTRNDFQTVTHIAPSTMDKPTERINLEGSMLNIAYDTDANMRGCSSYLKSLAGNDIITGNHKFCDSHSFTSRAKIISSCNHIPRIDDDSYGMRRKLMFCRFEARFDNGIADTHMREKLQAELPAIYNRIYSAYLALVKREAERGQNAIHPSCDQEEILREFSMYADPISDFWRTVRDDYLSRKEISKPEAFTDFKRFAERNNIDLMREGIRERTFHAKFFAILREDTGISADNNLRRRDEEGRTYYYTMSRKHEPEKNNENTAPEPPEDTAPPEGREAMTDHAEKNAPPEVNLTIEDIISAGSLELEE